MHASMHEPMNSYPADHLGNLVYRVKKYQKQEDDKGFGTGFDGCTSHWFGGLPGRNAQICGRLLDTSFLKVKVSCDGKLLFLSVCGFMHVRSRLAVITSAG